MNGTCQGLFKLIKQPFLYFLPKSSVREATVETAMETTPPSAHERVTTPT